MHTYSKKELMNLITGKLRRNFGRDVEEATSLHMFKACALVLRDIINERQLATEDRVSTEHLRQVHYLSLEFLMGRSLMKNAYNLGLLAPLTAAIEALSFSAPDLFETEPDAGLGNGGLGRLAACYLDSMTTLEVPATGYSICYELGIFKQKIVEGQQVELPDNWKDLGAAWLMPSPPRPRRSASAARCGSSGTTATCTSSTRMPPWSRPCPATWRSPATARSM